MTEELRKCQKCGGYGFIQEKCAGGSKIGTPCPDCHPAQSELVKCKNCEHVYGSDGCDKNLITNKYTGVVNTHTVRWRKDHNSKGKCPDYREKVKT